ncbi:Meiotically up-regulated protein [Pseudozyma hubeiensis]|nr:Meiotically up-regulated protein [Pseudozyma hubeiensis]
MIGCMRDDAAAAALHSFDGLPLPSLGASFLHDCQSGLPGSFAVGLAVIETGTLFLRCRSPPSRQLKSSTMRAGREHAQRNLYVLNLPLDATTDQFEELFAQFGSVAHAVILATLDHMARRRGFILMSDPLQAAAAIEHLNGYQWHNYRIEVSFAIVQRSGTPFSHESANAISEQRPSRPDVIGAAHPRDDGAFANVQPPVLPLLAQQGPQPSGSRAPDPDRDSALLLDGLDTTVLTSPRMIRALTEPFGHIVDVRNADRSHSSWCGGRALVKYCCYSSASLAQLSLHGLVVGASRISATFARSRSYAVFGQYDADRSPAEYPDPSSLAATPEAEPGVCSRADSMPPPLQSHHVTPGQLDDTAPSIRASQIAEQHASKSGGAAVESWQTSAVSGTCDDAVLVDRRTLPRPIGDERQRCIRTTK